MKHQYTVKTIPLFLGGILCILQIAVVSAAPGDLDLTFNGTGISRIAFRDSDDRGNAMAVQSDGKVVVAGSTLNTQNSSHDFSLVRYNTDGSLDNSFSGDGQVTTFFFIDDVANAVAIQADGKIVVAGYASIGSNSDFAVARYNTDGSLDTTFDGDGKVTTDLGGDDRGNGVALRDGKIIVAGNGGTGENRLRVVRYNTDGSLDTSFSDDGIAARAIHFANAVTIQPDGRVVVTGRDGSFLAVVRFNTDGSNDTSFGSNGVVLNSVPGAPIPSGHAVGIQKGNNTLQNPDKIVVAGTTPLDSLIIRYNMDGSLDTSFDNDGKLITSFGGSRDTALAVGFQIGIGGAANRIIIAGYTEEADGDFAVARFLLSGALDTTFDGDGIATTPIRSGHDEGRGMAIQAGKIIVAGSSCAGTSSNTASDLAVARYNVADGSLDQTFDGDGIRIDNFSPSRGVGRDVAIQPDGKIVVAGFDDNGSQSEFAVARYNTDGSLDNSFGGDGKVTIGLGVDDRAFAVAVQVDGKIVVAGEAFTGSNGFGILRYNADGSIDTSFPALINISNTAVADMAIQVDGKIVLAGSRFNGVNNDFFVFRFNTNGSTDLSFGDNGEVITPVGGDDEGKAVAIQPDRKIVVAGSSFNGADSEFAVVRYNTNGSLDAAFGSDGKVITQVGSSFDKANAIALQANGRIVIAGNTLNDFAVVRYNTNGSLDTSFDGDGIAITLVGTSTDQANGVAIQTDGRIVVAGTSFNVSTGDDFAVVRYNSDGSLDTSYSGDGKVFVNVTNGVGDKGMGVALDSAGNAVVAGEAGGLLCVVRLLGGSAGCDYSLTPASDYVSARGGPCNFNVTTEADCAWTVQTSDPWIVIVSDPAGAGNGTVSLEVRDNFNSSARLGTVTAGGEMFTIVQEGRGTSCSYLISPTFASFLVGGGTGSINLTTSSACGWQAVSNQSWIVITSNDVGIGDSTINYTVSANSTGAVRDGAILVGGRTFKVKQKGS